MATSNRAKLVAPSGNLDQWRRTAQNWIQQANRGNLNCTGQLTLAIDSNATTVLDARVGVASFVDFMPQTAHAAAAKRLLTVQSQSAGGFVVAHANNSIADRIYTYCIVG